MAKFQSTEDAAYLKIYSLYKMLIYHDSPNKKNVANMVFEQCMVTHEEWNMLFKYFPGKISVNRRCSQFGDIQPV